VAVPVSPYICGAQVYKDMPQTGRTQPFLGVLPVPFCPGLASCLIPPPSHSAWGTSTFLGCRPSSRTAHDALCEWLRCQAQHCKAPQGLPALARGGRECGCCPRLNSGPLAWWRMLPSRCAPHCIATLWPLADTRHIPVTQQPTPNPTQQEEHI
jgi:hypothetical protein